MGEGWSQKLSPQQTFSLAFCLRVGPFPQASHAPWTQTNVIGSSGPSHLGPHETGLFPTNIRKFPGKFSDWLILGHVIIPGPIAVADSGTPLHIQGCLPPDAQGWSEKEHFSQRGGILFWANRTKNKRGGASVSSFCNWYFFEPD